MIEVSKVEVSEAEKLKQYIYSEPLEPVDYNSAARYLCRKILEFAKRNPQAWREILAMYKVLDVFDESKFRSEEQKYVVDVLYQFAIEVVLKHLNELMDDELRAEVERIAPTTFMWSWAVNRAVYLSMSGTCP